MRRIRLAVFGSSPCHLCTAACCKQNGHEYAAILRGDREVRKFAAFSVDARIRHGETIVVEKVLPYREGRCQFLGGDDRCMIYEDRPGACRAFQCIEYFNQQAVGAHGRFLELNPTVTRMLVEM